MAVPVYCVQGLVPRLACLPDQRRPGLFKGKTPEEMGLWIRRARQALAEMFGADANFRTSDLNIQGSDLAVVGSDEEIELKTGQVTHANLGVSTVAWMMGDKDEPELRSIMAAPMQERRRMALAGDFAGVRASQERTMERLCDYFQERLTVDDPAPNRVAHYARAVAHGITQKSAVVPLLGRTESEWPAPTVLHARWRKGWVRVTNPFEAEEVIVVDSIFRQAGANRGSRIPRAQARVRGISSNRTVRIYPNYKNSYKGKEGRVAAKHWVRTACFHLWIDR